MSALIGDSPAMRHMRQLIERVAATDATVLITGESGVGKEKVAQTIHARSRRQQGPFVAINCAAIPPSLIETELFGHEKGSFTGATRSHEGVFERAVSGTLFLDEIAEMPLDMQTRLLRVLETRRLTRVGGSTEIAVDARIISATNRDVTRAASQGQLRRDLVYRLAVFPIEVPALRTRGRDVLALAAHFLDELNARGDTARRFASGTEEFLLNHDWPGNVRELRNCIERANILAVDDEVRLDESMLLPVAASTVEDDNCIRVPIGTCLAEVERRLILATLEHFGGNKNRTAGALGCSVKTVYNKLNQYRETTGGPTPG